VELVHWALKRKGGQSVLKRMKVMFLAVNAFLYVFLLVLVIIFISLEASISTTDVRCLFPLALRCGTVPGVTSTPSVRAPHHRLRASRPTS
jgi:hypothetical protein